MPLTTSEIAQRLQQLDEYDFEVLVADLWERRGWKTEVTGKSNDRGIDVIATRESPYSEKQLIQAKRFQPTNRVGSRDIQQYSSLKHQEPNVDQVIVVTTSGYTDSALNLAKDLNVKCVDGATLAQMIRENGGADLIEPYAAETDSDPGNILERIKTGPRESTEEQEPEQRETTIAQDGDRLTAELTGLKRVNTTFSGQGILRSDTNLEGVLATFKLYGRSDNYDLLLEEKTEVKFFDERGTEYYPAQIGPADLPTGWVALGGRQRWVEIPSSGSVNFAVGVSMPSHAKVSKITIDRYGIELNLDHEVREQLNRLPDEIRDIV